MQTLLRHFEPETLTQNRRVQDGGGKIIDSFYVNQMIRRLKEQGLYLNGTAIPKAFTEAIHITIGQLKEIEQRLAMHP